jgi:hypothetical protein
MSIKRRMKTGGKKMHPVLKFYTERYNLSPKQREILSRFLVQFVLCQDEAARRLLLGVRA